MISEMYFGKVAAIINFIDTLAYVAIACSVIVLLFAVPYYLLTYFIIQKEELNNKETKSELPMQYFWWDMNEDSLKK